MLHWKKALKRFFAAMKACAQLSELRSREPFQFVAPPQEYRLPVMDLKACRQRIEKWRPADSRLMTRWLRSI